MFGGQDKSVCWLVGSFSMISKEGTDKLINLVHVVLVCPGVHHCALLDCAGDETKLKAVTCTSIA